MNKPAGPITSIINCHDSVCATPSGDHHENYIKTYSMHGKRANISRAAHLLGSITYLFLCKTKTKQKR